MTPSSTSASLDAAFQRVREMDVSLGEQLRTFADAARQRTPGFAEAVDRLVERIRQNGVGQSAPRSGDPMPPFVLPDDAGHLVTLDQLLSQGPVAVTFHRGHWCPYCRININALAQAHKDIAAEGGQIVAIMPDRQKFTAELRSNATLPFPILTDIDNGYALSLNLAIWIGEEIQTMLQGRQDLPTFQGNTSWMLLLPPHPATLPGGTGRDDYVAGTIAMSGANGAVIVEVTNVGDEAVDIQQGDQLTTIEPGATSMFSSDFCGQRLCMANSQILQNGSARAVRPRRRRAARDRSLVPRSRAGSIGIGLFSEGDHTGRMGGRPAVWKPWRRAARSYRQGRSSNANGLRWRVSCHFIASPHEALWPRRESVQPRATPNCRCRH